MLALLIPPPLSPATDGHGETDWQLLSTVPTHAPTRTPPSTSASLACHLAFAEAPPVRHMCSTRRHLPPAHHRKATPDVTSSSTRRSLVPLR